VVLELNNTLRSKLTIEVGLDSEILLAAGGIISGPQILNSGVIGGTGTIDATLYNEAKGEIRVGQANSLRLTGASHENLGKLEVIGGSLEVQGPFANMQSTGLIAGRGATVRFQNGLTNRGSVALAGGTNDIFGDINNLPGSTITVTGGSSAVFYDDVIQNGVLRIAQVGASASTAVFLGSFTGSGGTTGGGDIFLEGDLRPGNSPGIVTFGSNLSLGAGAITDIELGGLLAGSQYDRVIVSGALNLDGELNVTLLGGFSPTAGQEFDILNWGSLSGEFAGISLPALRLGQSWDLSRLYADGILSVKTTNTGDFNSDGSVDGADLESWKLNYGIASGASQLQGDANLDGSVDGSDFLEWQRQRNTSPSPAATVPEPTTLALSLFAGIMATILERSRSRIA
jgi:hypothetical protein